MGNVYVADVEYLAGVFKQQLGVEPRRWKCPCGEPKCSAVVLHARGVDGRFYFMANHTFKTEPPYNAVVIDNVEDVELFLDSALLPEGDMHAFACYFASGFKAALFVDA